MGTIKTYQEQAQDIVAKAISTIGEQQLQRANKLKH